jgi:hypothetical protein
MISVFPSKNMSNYLNISIDYYAFGMQMPNRYYNSEKYRYGYNGQEKENEIAGAGNINTAEFWEYDTRLAVRWNPDPIVKHFESRYSVFGRNPILMIDPNGDDWFKNEKTGKVEWNNTSGKVGEQVSLKGSYDTWTNLGKVQYSKTVIDAVGSNILKGGWPVFMDYYLNKQFGENFFYKAASTYSDNASGLMASIRTQVPSIKDGLLISIMTHDWVNQAGWTEEKNALEHNIGMFLMASKWGPAEAHFIGIGNELRGFFINDRQNNNMFNALLGKPAKNGGPTAFEWKDLKNNIKGVDYFIHFSEINPKANKHSSYLKDLPKVEASWELIRKSWKTGLPKH